MFSLASLARSLPSFKLKPTFNPIRTVTLLAPKNRKWPKAQKGRVPVRTGGSTKGSSVAFGAFGIRVKDGVRITAAQIEACSAQLKRKIKVVKGSKFWLRVFPDIPATKKATGVRMGKGKGAIDHYYCRVPKDKILFEVSDMRQEIAIDALRSIGFKLPVKTQVVIRKSDSLSIAADEERSSRVKNQT